MHAFGGEVEAVFLDVGGVFHLPNPEIIGAALRRAGVDGSLEPELLDRAHYAGIHALVDWPATERGIWTAYQEAYAREVGAPPECVSDVVAGSTPAARAKTAGMSSMNSTTSPSSRLLRNSCSSAEALPRPACWINRTLVADLANSGQLSRAALLSVREPWLPFV